VRDDLDAFDPPTARRWAESHNASIEGERAASHLVPDRAEPDQPERPAAQPPSPAAPQYSGAR